MGQGLWQFMVMPFGLCNTPKIFKRLMEAILMGLKSCLVYFNDVTVAGQTFQE
jgi:hypothetical protein